MKKTIMTILFFFHLFLLIGQQKKIDSLKIELDNASIEKKAKIYNEIAYESFLIGKPDECILIGNKALKISQENKLKDQEAIAYKFIAIGETYSGKENQAFETYQKAINIFDETENFEQIARIYNNISQIYLQHGNLAEVHRYLNMALELREEHNIPDVTLFGSLGNLYQLLGMYDKSLKYNLESIKLAEEINDIEGLAFGYNGLGLIYQIRNELNKSKESYQKGLSIFENLERKRHIASLNNNLGDICVLTGQFDSAFYYFNKSLKIKEELNYNEGIIFTYLAIGDLYLKTDTLIKAINNYQKAIKTAEDINALYLLSLSYNKLAVGYLKQNKYILAKELFMESNKLAENNKSLELINSNYYHLAKIDSTNGNYKSAFYNFYKHKSAKDSMFTKEKSKQITEMQIRYETEKKEQQISFLSKQNRNQKITNIIITIALVLSFLTILLLYNRFKMRRKVLRAKKLQVEAKLEEQKAIQRQQELESKLKLEEEQRKQEELKSQAELTILNNEKLQAELDYSHRELSSSTMYAYQKNEILGKIGELLSEVSPENQNAKEKIKAANHIIKNNLDDENEWERLKLHFEKVHPNFFSRIHEKYPTLTQHELKHCAYLKIKLSNKEIAALLNVSPRSMQMARYRLKKKMDLGPDEDLLEFIDVI